MGNRAKRSGRHIGAALVLFAVALFGAACGSDAEEPAEAEQQEQPVEVVELEPAPFDLPDDCDGLLEFAAEAREAYDASEVNTQELVDAKARFDGAVNEQMMLGCV